MSGNTADLNRIRYFLAVAEAGSFTAAAERLDVAKAIVSQQVARLEGELGVTLFTRTTRRVVLTEAGEAFSQRCGPLLQQLDDAVQQLDAAHAEPRGVLRVTAPADYAASMLAPALAAFARPYPGLQLDVVATHEVLDLVAERIDLAIRMGWLQDSSLKASKLASFAQWVVASPGFAASSTVSHPAELATQPAILLNLLASPATWTFAAAGIEACTVRLNGVAQTNSPPTLLALVQAGAGIGIAPDFMVQEAIRRGELIRLLPDWQLPEGGIYAVYPAGRHLPAKVRLFIDFFRDWLGRQANQAISSSQSALPPTTR